MRMEELNNNNYIKSTDSVERYLLNVVQEYFDSMKISDTNSREYIIQKAVERMKEELLIDNAGVLSVNGLTGAVTITLEDLNGEPKIEVKNGAFNASFGTMEGDVCEGNDARLSDARTPLPHEHTPEEIVGLAGILSSIETSTGKIEDYKHEHPNKVILDKITYSGDKAVIDLFFLDSVETKITELTNLITTTVDPLPDLVNTTNQEVSTVIANTKTEIDNFILTTTEQVNQINQTNKETIETKFNELKEELSGMISGQVTTEDINYIVATLNKTPSLVLQGEIVIADAGLSFKEQIETIDTTLDLTATHMEFDLVVTTNGVEEIHAIPYHKIAAEVTTTIVLGFVIGQKQIKWQILNNASPISETSILKLRYRGYQFPQLTML